MNSDEGVQPVDMPHAIPQHRVRIDAVSISILSGFKPDHGAPDACLIFLDLEPGSPLMEACLVDDNFCDIYSLGPQNKVAASAINVAASAIHGTV